GDVIHPFSLASCRPLTTDATRTRVNWSGADDLSSLAGRPIQFRFHLRDGHLYAFWVSPSASGASNGYLAAGGPGLSGPVDV
ncbi:MAG: glycosyl hydrolase family 32, partial [Chloroflexota bacterium]|nr:glycosyl hydrolase family 32 [Chloroflexota bacterium]